MTVAEKIIRAKADYDEVYEAGQRNEHKAFWNAYLPDNLANWQYLFYSPRWNDDNFYPTKDIKPKGSFTFGLSSHFITNLKQRLIDCGVTLDTSGVTSGNYMVAYASSLTHLPTLSFVGLTEAVKSMFDNNKMLVEIEKIILPSSNNDITFVNWFYRCYELQHITFEGLISNNIDFKDCPKLTKASITSIINALSTTTSGLTLTLSRDAVDVAFWDYSSLDEVPGTMSAEWYRLVETRNNWTITLV